LAVNRVEAKNLIDTHKAEVHKAVNYISQYEVYGLKQPVMLYGRELWAHIYFDSEKQAFDEKVRYIRIERLRGELEVMDRPKKVAKRFLDYFVVDAQLEGETV